LCPTVSKVVLGFRLDFPGTNHEHPGRGQIYFLSTNSSVL